MAEPIPLEVPSLVVDGSQFETVRYPDDEIKLRVTDSAADLVETAGRFGVTLG